MTGKSLNDKRCYDISENIKRIHENISEAAIKALRSPSEIKLMAVTKTVEPLFINYAIDNCGIDLIGENRVQELLSKEPDLHLQGVDTHIIGHLQTNKVKSVLHEINMIESVDSIHIAEEIQRQCVKDDYSMDILLEINIGCEEAKTGFLYEEVHDACLQIAEFDRVHIKGLMSVPPICEDEKKLRAYFARIYKLYIDIRSEKIDNIDMGILSLGMTGDYKTAVSEGSNLVRIGSGIFGARTY